jgi:hypothetical protein
MLYVVVVVAVAVVAVVVAVVAVVAGSLHCSYWCQPFPICVIEKKSKVYSHSHSHLVSALGILETPTPVTTEDDHYLLPPPLLLLLLLLWKDLLLRVPMREPTLLLDRSCWRNETCC